MTGQTRVVTHQVRRLEVAVDLPFEEFRERYEKAVPPFEPGHFFDDHGPDHTDWATINRITDQQARHGFLLYWRGDRGDVTSVRWLRGCLMTPPGSAGA